MIDVSCWPCRAERSTRRCDRTQSPPPRPNQWRGAMTDREVEAISAFLRHFGSFGCRQICVRRAEPKPRTPEDVGRVVLESLAAWRAEGLDAERLYKVATIAIHFEAYKLPGPICMPACCRPWGALEPACPRRSNKPTWSSRAPFAKIATTETQARRES